MLKPLSLTLALIGSLGAASCATQKASSADESVLTFAVLGDAEPKPDPVFPGTEAAIRDINLMAAMQRMDFVIGVGDLAHDGSLDQYEAVTPILGKLNLPFYPIMGNEERTSTLPRYLDYAHRWNGEVSTASYVQDRGPVVLVHASPDTGRDYADQSIDWMIEAIRAADKPVFLIVHSAQAGAFPENAEKGVTNPRFAEVLAQPNLAAVISGDLHMDMNRTDHSKQIGRVHYLHIPGLERTKIPDETVHEPLFRTFSISKTGQVVVRTYHVGEAEPLAAMTYRFSLGS